MVGKIVIFLFLMSGLNFSVSETSHDKGDTADYMPLEVIRIKYGNNPLQFGDLRLPEGNGPFAVVVIIHGGCWRSSYELSLMDKMAVDLTQRGYATWNLEYRRTEDDGGGWPGTFQDVASGLKYVNTLAGDYPINTDQLLVTGHSAGGHLSLWLGAHGKLEKGSELYVDGLPPIKGIISLAGITDLRSYLAPSGCGSNVVNLIGGMPEEFPDRYKEGSPIEFLPLGIPQILINGEKDDIVSLEHVTPYFEKARNLGDEVMLVTIPEAGHFEVITPGSVAWEAILDSFGELVNW